VWRKNRMNRRWVRKRCWRSWLRIRKKSIWAEGSYFFERITTLKSLMQTSKTPESRKEEEENQNTVKRSCREEMNVSNIVSRSITE
jgi:hypothetical protein